jgi:hypothetical protein
MTDEEAIRLAKIKALDLAAGDSIRVEFEQCEARMQASDEYCAWWMEGAKRRYGGSIPDACLGEAVSPLTNYSFAMGIWYVRLIEASYAVLGIPLSERPDPAQEDWDLLAGMPPVDRQLINTFPAYRPDPPAVIDAPIKMHPRKKAP